MGTDIHVKTEAYNKETGKWEKLYLYSYDNLLNGGLREVDAYSTRNYELFSILAGVRGNAIPIDSCRNIPEDTSIGVTNDVENDEKYCHNFTWYTLDELKEAAEDKKCYTKRQRRELKRFIFGVEFVAEANWYFGDDSNIRVIIYFDS